MPYVRTPVKEYTPFSLKIVRKRYLADLRQMEELDELDSEKANRYREHLKEIESEMIERGIEISD